MPQKNYLALHTPSISDNHYRNYKHTTKKFVYNNEKNQNNPHFWEACLILLCQQKFGMIQGNRIKKA